MSNPSSGVDGRNCGEIFCPHRTTGRGCNSSPPRGYLPQEQSCLLEQEQEATEEELQRVSKQLKQKAEQADQLEQQNQLLRQDLQKVTGRFEVAKVCFCGTPDDCFFFGCHANTQILKSTKVSFWVDCTESQLMSSVFFPFL